MKRKLDLERLEHRDLLAIFQVTNLDDSAVLAPGDAPGTLRQAVFDANALPGADTIDFAPGVTGSIELFEAITATESITIAGPGPDYLSIDNVRGGGTLAFLLADKSRVTLSGFSILSGSPCAADCGFYSIWISSPDDGTITTTIDEVVVVEGFPGVSLRTSNTKITNSVVRNAFDGIRVRDGTLTVENTTITDNLGVGVSCTNCTLEVRESRIANNQSYRRGGGIRCISCSLAVHDSLIEKNIPRADETRAGGIAAYSPRSLLIENSTISDNRSHDGAGIFLDARNDTDLVIRNSTISGNTAVARGGGILLFSGNVVLENTTIVNNNTLRLIRNTGGGVLLESGSHVIRNTIIAGNDLGPLRQPSAPDLRVQDDVENLTVTNSIVGDRSGTELVETLIPDEHGNLIGGPINGSVDPILGPLANHGGATPTHALLPGSPAINAGDPNFMGPQHYDQRGAPFTRVSAGRMDIGAYELQPSPADFNDDEQFNCGDVDALVAAIVQGNNFAAFDLTGDELVNVLDLDSWLVLAGIEARPSHESFVRGDVNLDGAVNVSDLNIVGNYWLQDVGGWCRGDLTADGRVDPHDLNLLARNWLSGVSFGAATSAVNGRALPTPLANHASSVIGLVVGDADDLAAQSRSRYRTAHASADVEVPELSGSASFNALARRRGRRYAVSSHRHPTLDEQEPSKIDKEELVDGHKQLHK